MDGDCDCDCDCGQVVGVGTGIEGHSHEGDGGDETINDIQEGHDCIDEHKKTCNTPYLTYMYDHAILPDRSLVWKQG